MSNCNAALVLRDGDANSVGTDDIASEQLQLSGATAEKCLDGSVGTDDIASEQLQRQISWRTDTNNIWVGTDDIASEQLQPKHLSRDFDRQH